MMKISYKVADDGNPTFKGHTLSKLMVHDENGRQRRGSEYSTYLVMRELLSGYGIHVFGKIQMLDCNKKDTGVNLVAVSISKDIPEENILVIDQIYGWRDNKISICIDRKKEYELSFYYNTKDKSCELVKLVFGNEKNSMLFPNFKKMMDSLRVCDFSLSIFEKTEFSNV